MKQSQNCSFSNLRPSYFKIRNSSSADIKKARVVIRGLEIGISKSQLKRALTSTKAKICFLNCKKKDSCFLKDKKIHEAITEKSRDKKA
jgi:hypothetical protein